MDLPEILKIINEYWTDGKLHLPPEALDSPKIEQLMRQQLPEGHLTVSNMSSPLIEGKKVIVRGGKLDGGFLGMTEPEVVAEFWPDGKGKARTSIRFSNQELEYQFQKIFPDFEYEFKHLPSFTNPVYSLDSEAGNGALALQEQYAYRFYSDEWEKKVTKGLSFRSRLKLPKGWEWMETLVGEDRFEFSGPIDRLNKTPRYWLRSGQGEPLQLGHLKLGFTFQFMALYGPQEIDNWKSLKHFP